MEDLVALKFNEPLSWRAGKPIATGELLRRLEKLSRELVDMDQETVDKESLTKVAKELASHNLLAHKEGGVKAFSASCLVDILKLCAPDAPFTPSQLKVRISSRVSSLAMTTGRCWHVVCRILANDPSRISSVYSSRSYFPHYGIRPMHTTPSTNMCLRLWPRSRAFS